MLHISKVIQKISEKDSKEFVFWLKQNDAGKYAQLFSIMRENKMKESDMAEELNTSPSGFYALKSRLNAKIQEFFAHNVPDTDIDLLKNVANIPSLLYNSPRETAITHLLKMEKELIEHDIPYALTTVYSALKKLNRYSQKYFEYAQLYNKHLAYTMAIDKARELLSDFNKTLGEYLMSRDEKLLEVLCIIRQEMHNYAQLYESHRLKVYRNILEVEFLLFSGAALKEKPEWEADEVLLKTEKIITSYKNDADYGFLQTLINYLWFQYYHQHNLHKKAAGYYALVNEKLFSLMLNNFCCFPSAFLISKIEKHLYNNEEEKLYEESKLLSVSFSPDTSDVPNYINYIKFNAAAAFYAKKYNEAISLLNNLLNTVSFRSFPHADIEIKLFLALCYLLVNNSELADYLIRNVQRKLRVIKTDELIKSPKKELYGNVQAYTKMLALSIDSSIKGRDKKLLKYRDEFQSLNRKEGKLLEFIRLDDTFLRSLLQNC